MDCMGISFSDFNELFSIILKKIYCSMIQIQNMGYMFGLVNFFVTTVIAVP